MLSSQRRDPQRLCTFRLSSDVARSSAQHAALTASTFAGAIKLRCEELNRTLGSIGRCAGMSANSIRARLSRSRGKRALQPWQVTAIARELAMDERILHTLAARHEGWKVDHPGVEGQR